MGEVDPWITAIRPRCRLGHFSMVPQDIHICLPQPMGAKAGYRDNGVGEEVRKNRRERKLR